MHYRKGGQILKKLTLKQKDNAKGYLFILPFVIGFVLFFAYPFLQSFLWSFGDVSFRDNAGLTLKGIENYVYALRSDPNFYKLVYTSVTDMILRLPLIIIFSFIMANFLKPKFTGRNVFRVIFFLPVILSSGIVTSMENYSLVQDLSGLVTVSSLQEFLVDMNFPAFLAEYISGAVDGVATIVNNSGIQILIFLAALQSISPSIYEAASIEGATAWEGFWKITFPIVIPQIIVCMVYTVVNSFVSATSETVNYIYEMAFTNFRYGISSAMSVIYTVVIIVMLALFVGTAAYAAKRYDS